MNINKYKKYIPAFLQNKFIFTLLLSLIWITFIDSNDWISRAKDLYHIKQLEKDKAFYIEKIAQDKISYNELHFDKNKLEKFSREKYLMKKKDEDLFIIVEY
ncbi:MAG: septum formation initiator family protein [Bacteroidetes bacterium]|jgi:cell division protein DivIC|nr:septum formation initiator family protein [Bacteroidota bacterium]MBT6684725.1 septum formation initiator family protein [Bacteroidota bacterium]MBT7143826.1 septum formation initiator family protein [Bacteroidota bacterium]MBT7489993.1 septum formation initiator family protein [Bacteroidota bacterium]